MPKPITIARITTAVINRRKTLLRIEGIGHDSTHIITRHGMRRWRGQFPKPPLKLKK